MAHLTEDMINAMAKAVYAELGADHDEVIYKHAMLVELRNAEFIYDCEQTVEVRYKGQFVGWGSADIIVRCGADGDVLLELKKKSKIGKSHVQQARNYMRQLGIKRGFVINFACSSDAGEATVGDEDGETAEMIQVKPRGAKKPKKSPSLAEVTVKKVTP